MPLSPIKHAACLLDETTRDVSCTCRQMVNQYPYQVKGYSSLGKTSSWPFNNRCRKGRPYSHLCTFFQVTHLQYIGVSDSGLGMRDHCNALCAFSQMTLQIPPSVAKCFMRRRQTAALFKMPAELCAAHDCNQHICTATHCEIITEQQRVSSKQRISDYQLHHPVALLNCNVTVACAGKKAASGQEQMGQVQISTAFQSPDLLQSCLAFLRQYATDTGSHAACAVVPKQSIAYPQVLWNLSVLLWEES